MSEKYWKILACGFFISQTMCAILLIEFLALGKPYISLFWVIYAVMLYFNFKRYAPEKLENIKQRFF